jgi:hypothetical protein
MVNRRKVDVFCRQKQISGLVKRHKTRLAYLSSLPEIEYQKVFLACTEDTSSLDV